jgi:hypothetical protein
MLAFKEWKTLYEAGKLTVAQKRFFEPQEPEELYDLSIDPHEMNNLANNPQYAAKLHELRGILKKHLTDRNDLGLIPESEWEEEAAKDLVAYGNKMHKQIAKYSDIIDLELLPFAEAKPLLKKALASSDAIENFWAATVCISFGKQAEALKEDVKPLLAHASPIVRSRAGVFLSSVKQAEPASLMPDILYSALAGAESLLILGDMVYLQDYICGPVFTLSKDKLKYTKEPYHRRIDYLTNKK